MPVVTGPLFSLKASGLLGKTIFFYDTKHGARVRRVRKRFTPPGTVWEVNKVWFKMASDRWKYDLAEDMKWAWTSAYPDVCDVGRDLFMGRQIEMWNLSPLNMVTWPPVGVSSVGDFTIWNDGAIPATRVGFQEFNKLLFERYTCCTLWARKLDDNTPPGEGDIIKKIQRYSTSIDIIEGHDNYLWGGVRYNDGSWVMIFIAKVSWF